MINYDALTIKMFLYRDYAFALTKRGIKILKNLLKICK